MNAIATPSAHTTGLRSVAVAVATLVLGLGTGLLVGLNCSRTSHSEQRDSITNAEIDRVVAQIKVLSDQIDRAVHSSDAVRQVSNSADQSREGLQQGDVGAILGAIADLKECFGALQGDSSVMTQVPLPSDVIDRQKLRAIGERVWSDTAAVIHEHFCWPPWKVYQVYGQPTGVSSAGAEMNWEYETGDEFTLYFEFRS